MSAERAFERLKEQPVPLGGAEPAPAIAPATPGVSPRPAKITGADLGLMLDWEGDGSSPVLVPAWLFEVEGQEAPVAVVAIEDEHLD